MLVCINDKHVLLQFCVIVIFFYENSIQNIPFEASAAIVLNIIPCVLEVKFCRLVEFVYSTKYTVKCSVSEYKLYFIG